MKAKDRAKDLLRKPVTTWPKEAIEFAQHVKRRTSQLGIKHTLWDVAVGYAHYGEGLRCNSIHFPDFYRSFWGVLPCELPFVLRG